MRSLKARFLQQYRAGLPLRVPSTRLVSHVVPVPLLALDNFEIAQSCLKLGIDPGPFVIALCSPQVLVETGLRFCCPEKNSAGWPYGVWRVAFSSPVRGCESRNLGDFLRFLEQLGGVSLRSRLYGGAGWIRTHGTALKP
jgi:hypothetical protein